MSRVALILAGGQGKRLGTATPKPLVKVGAFSILRRTIVTLASTGVSRILILTKHEHDQFRHAIASLQERVEIPVELMASHADKVQHLLLGLNELDDASECFVLPGDHVFHPDILGLLAGEGSGGGFALAVSMSRGRLRRVKTEDVKVRLDLEAGKIREIGRQVAHFNAIDTGAYLWHMDLRSKLLDYISRSHPTSLSGFTNLLAHSGLGKWVDVGELEWINVDREQDYEAGVDFVGRIDRSQN